MIKLTFLILVLYSFNTFAAITVEGCQAGKQKEYESGTTIKWSGSCVNGMATGKGKLQWFEDGDLSEWYEGELKNGLYDGKGVWTSVKENVRYEGEFRGGDFNGRGIYTDEEGDSYDGEFYNGKKHGYVLIIYSRGTSKTARFENDLRVSGIFDFPGLWYTDDNTNCKLWNNSPFGIVKVNWTGDCVAGKANGKGIAEWFYNGKLYSRYEGEYFLGKRHGKGNIVWGDNAHYEGEWKSDERTGKGVFTWADGSRYEGNFENQKLEGFGELIIPRSAYDENKQPPDYPSYSKKGLWLKDQFVQRGYFSDDWLLEVCPSEKTCKPIQDELRVKKALEKKLNKGN